MTSTALEAGWDRAPSAAVQEHDAYEDVRVLLVATVLGGAAVHAAVVREHLTHWPAAGLFFVLLSSIGLVIGMALLRRVDPVWLLAALALSVGPLAVWLVSRTAGLPFGPEAGEPERVALTDTAACLLAVTSGAAAVLLLRAASRLRGRMLPRAAPVIALGLVSVITAVGLTSSAVSEPEHVEHAHTGRVCSGQCVSVEGGDHLTTHAG